MSRSMKGVRFCPYLQTNKFTRQFHGCWQKIWCLWIRDKGFNYGTSSSQLSAFFCSSSLNPNSHRVVKRARWQLRMHRASRVTDRSHGLREPESFIVGRNLASKTSLCSRGRNNLSFPSLFTTQVFLKIANAKAVSESVCKTCRKWETLR